MQVLALHAAELSKSLDMMRDENNQLREALRKLESETLMKSAREGVDLTTLMPKGYVGRNVKNIIRNLFIKLKTGHGLVVKSEQKDMLILLGRMIGFVKQLDTVEGAQSGSTEALFEQVSADAVANRIEGSMCRLLLFNKKTLKIAMRNDPSLVGKTN